jgi:IS30 family transposase
MMGGMVVRRIECGELNGGAENYRAIDAQSQADVNRARPKGRKLEELSRLHDAVNDGLRQKCRPSRSAKDCGMSIRQSSRDAGVARNDL